MEYIIPICVIILAIVLFFKVTKAILKAVFAFVFVGFVIYLFTGTNIINTLISFFNLTTTKKQE